MSKAKSPHSFFDGSNSAIKKTGIEALAWLSAVTLFTRITNLDLAVCVPSFLGAYSFATVFNYNLLERSKVSKFFDYDKLWLVPIAMGLTTAELGGANMLADRLLPDPAPMSVSARNTLAIPGEDQPAVPQKWRIQADTKLVPIARP